MKKLLLFLLLAVPAFGQITVVGGDPNMLLFPSTPTGACIMPNLAQAQDTGSIYYCGPDLTWKLFVGGGGSGDVVGPATSVDSELALFSGTGGNAIKRATGTGIAKITSGVLGTASAGDFPTLNQNTTGTAAGITGKTLQGNGTLVPLATGTATANKQLTYDASGNIIASASDVGAATGMPTGGTTGQVVVKNSNTDYDFRYSACLTDSVTGITIGAGCTLSLGDTGGSVLNWTPVKIAAGSACSSTTLASLTPAEGDYVKVCDAASYTDTSTGGGAISMWIQYVSSSWTVPSLAAPLLSGAIPSAVTATTQSANDGSTKLATTAYADRAGMPAVALTTGTPVSVSSTAPSVYYFNQHATAATAIEFDLPTASAGKQFCFANSYNGSAANTGALTIKTSAAGQYIIKTDGTLTASGGNMASSGAAGDAACVVGVDSTHWQFYSTRGTWN